MQKKIKNKKTKNNENKKVQKEVPKKIQKGVPQKDPKRGQYQPTSMAAPLQNLGKTVSRVRIPDSRLLSYSFG